MDTLDGWVSRLTTVPFRIDCGEMCLFGWQGSAPPVFTRPGYIDIEGPAQMSFTIFAAADDAADAFKRIIQARDNPYAIEHQFRLQATDYRGIEWSGGWVDVRLKGIPKRGWPLTGSLGTLSTEVTGSGVASESSVELVYQPKFAVPMETRMISTTSIGGREVLRKIGAGQHVVPILGADVTFSYSPDDNFLWVKAKTTPRFTHPYLENWISEPLRILLGQLIFPRLVARNFGEGRAHISLRPSPTRAAHSVITSLLRYDPRADPAEFWHLYAEILTLIAEHRDGGKPRFEAHDVTRFYEEIIEASRGSRWVLCLTLASSAEGLVKMLMDTSGVAIKQQRIRRLLQSLAGKGLIKSRHVDTWAEVRNSVMHGNLVVPWSSADEDARIMDLAELFHGLTREVIRRAVPR